MIEYQKAPVPEWAKDGRYVLIRENGDTPRVASFIGETFCSSGGKAEMGWRVIDYYDNWYDIADAKIVEWAMLESREK